MTNEKAITILEMFLHKQCDLGRTESAYDANTVWDAVNKATDALIAIKEDSGYQQGLIEGKVQERTRILSMIKNDVGSEVWENVE